MNKKGVSLGIVIFIIFIGFICFIGIHALISHYKYDKDCLNKIADKVCKESGYGYGEANWDLKEIIYCYTNKRTIEYTDSMKFTKQELNQCRKK